MQAFLEFKDTVVEQNIVDFIRSTKVYELKPKASKEENKEEDSAEPRTHSAPASRAARTMYYNCSRHGKPRKQREPSKKSRSAKAKGACPF